MKIINSQRESVDVKMRVLVLLFVCLVCSSGVSSATDYYVSTTGSNNNDGLSVANAFATPSYISRNVSAGDTIYLINGTWYNESFMFSDIAGNNVYATGNITHPITIKAYNGTPTLDGTSTTAYPLYLKDNDNTYNYKKGYINISDIYITNYTNGLKVQFVKNIHISNVNFQNSGTAAVAFTDINNSSLIDSYIYNNGWNSVQISSTYANTSNILIKNNTIHANTAHNLIDLFMNSANSSTGVSNVTIVDNTLYDCSWSGIFPHRADTSPLSFNNINISNNHIYDINQGAIQIGMFKNSIVSNNIIHDSGYGILGQVGVANANMGLVSNNRIYNITEQQSRINVILSTNNSTITLLENIVDYYKFYGGTAIVTNPINNTFSLQSSSGATIILNYTNNNVFMVDGSGSPLYLPNGSSYNAPLNTTITVTAYTMSATPTTNSTNVIITTFNTSEPQGVNITEFSANSTSGTNVIFKLWGLIENYNYQIKKNSVHYVNKTANTTGYIEFNDSEWSEHDYSIQNIGYNESLFVADNALYVGIKTNTYSDNSITQLDNVQSTDVSLSNVFSMVII